MAKTGQMTVLPAYAEQQAAIAPYYAVFSEQLKTARSRLAIAQGSKVDGILSTELTKAFKGEVSVQDALTSAATQIDTLLAAEH
jgi:multiple sugar transport system substrate-binding protein